MRRRFNHLDPENLASASELARVFEVPFSTVRTAIRRGIITPLVKYPRLQLFDRNDAVLRLASIVKL